VATQEVVVGSWLRWREGRIAELLAESGGEKDAKWAQKLGQL
jgi:hypothetical protein